MWHQLAAQNNHITHDIEWNSRLPIPHCLPCCRIARIFQSVHFHENAGRAELTQSTMRIWMWKSGIKPKRRTGNTVSTNMATSVRHCVEVTTTRFQQINESINKWIYIVVVMKCSFQNQTNVLYGYLILAHKRHIHVPPRMCHRQRDAPPIHNGINHGMIMIPGLW